MLEIGSLLDGKYKILSEIGHGGMSVVYMALNEKANKTWAVKEIRKDGKMDFNVVKQGLVAEIETLKKLKHPNLPSIVDVIEDKDSFIIVMDYIEGNSLDRALNESGPQSQEDVIDWAIQLCDVLGYLHSCTPPIIYRDMKPANIMLKPDGDIALIDFGTAKTYEIDLGETTGIGTIGYAAPEQYIGSGYGRTDARTDIYCLGITLYHLLTGIDPCKNVISDKSIRAVNQSFSHGLDEIIVKCTQSDPKDRYQSCEELLYALEHHNEMGEIYRKQQKKKLGIFISTLVAAVIFAGVSVFSGVYAEDIKSRDYDENIRKVSSIEYSFEEKIDLLKKCVVMSPERTEAYQGMLDLVLNEGAENEGYIITAKEAELIRWFRFEVQNQSAFGASQSEIPLDTLKRKNPEGHLEVCQDIGFALWYNYQNENVGYEEAKVWFGRIADESSTAKIFYDIADCRTKITRSGNNPNKGQIYIDLWGRLKDLHNISKELDDKSDRDIKIIVLREIVDRISESVEELLQEEVSSEEIKDLLNAVSKDAETLSGKVSNKEDKAKLKTIQDKINDALKRVDSIR